MQLIQTQNNENPKKKKKPFYSLENVPAPETIFMEDTNKKRTGKGSIVNVLATVQVCLH